MKNHEKKNSRLSSLLNQILGKWISKSSRAMHHNKLCKENSADAKVPLNNFLFSNNQLNIINSSCSSSDLKGKGVNEKSMEWHNRSMQAESRTYYPSRLNMCSSQIGHHAQRGQGDIKMPISIVPSVLPMAPIPGVTPMAPGVPPMAPGVPPMAPGVPPMAPGVTPPLGNNSKNPRQSRGFIPINSKQQANYTYFRPQGVGGSKGEDLPNARGRKTHTTLDPHVRGGDLTDNTDIKDNIHTDIPIPVPMPLPMPLPYPPPKQAPRPDTSIKSIKRNFKEKEYKATDANTLYPEESNINNIHSGDNISKPLNNTNYPSMKSMTRNTPSALAVGTHYSGRMNNDKKHKYIKAINLKVFPNNPIPGEKKKNPSHTHTASGGSKSKSKWYKNNFAIMNQVHLHTHVRIGGASNSHIY